MPKPSENFIQKLYKYFMTELHPPYMNFMGPMTDLTNRVSLNYNPNKTLSKGTKNYMIPTTKSDYESFFHDLYYYSPDDDVKFFADKDYIDKVDNLLGLAGIGAQYLKRTGEKIGIVGVNFKFLVDTIMDIASVVTVPELTAYQIFKDVVLPVYVYNKYLYPKAREKFDLSFNQLVNFFNFEKSDDYNEITNQIDKVKEKYNNYLSTVGTYKKLNDSVDEYFSINDNIDKEKAKKSYEEFYNEVNNYFTFLNKKYKQNISYKPTVLPALNYEFINEATNPVEVPRRIDESLDKLGKKLQTQYSNLIKDVGGMLRKGKPGIEEDKKIISDIIDDYIVDIDIPENMTIDEYIAQLDKEEIEKINKSEKYKKIPKRGYFDFGDSPYTDIYDTRSKLDINPINEATEKYKNIDKKSFVDYLHPSYNILYDTLHDVPLYTPEKSVEKYKEIQKKSFLDYLHPSYGVLYDTLHKEPLYTPEKPTEKPTDKPSDNLTVNEGVQFHDFEAMNNITDIEIQPFKIHHIPYLLP